MEFETQKLQVFKNPDTFISRTGKNVNCCNSYREIWQCISKLLKYLYLWHTDFTVKRIKAICRDLATKVVITSLYSKLKYWEKVTVSQENRLSVKYPYNKMLNSNLKDVFKLYLWHRMKFMIICWGETGDCKLKYTNNLVFKKQCCLYNHNLKGLKVTALGNEVLDDF